MTKNRPFKKVRVLQVRGGTYAGVSVAEDVCPTLTTYNNMYPLFIGEKDIVIRKIMPIEYERLFGFPDNYTNIGEDKESPSSYRYKACGNSICVNLLEWIGQRIDEVEKRDEERRD